MKTIQAAAFFMILCLAPLGGWADVDPAIADHLASKFQQADQIAGLISANSSQASDDDSVVEFKQFFLGLAPSATFGINSVLDLQVAPEITFTWEKTEL